MAIRAPPASRVRYFLSTRAARYTDDLRENRNPAQQGTGIGASPLHGQHLGLDSIVLTARLPHHLGERLAPEKLAFVEP